MDTVNIENDNEIQMTYDRNSLLLGDERIEKGPDNRLPTITTRWEADWIHKYVGTCFTREYYEDYELRKAEKDKLQRHVYDRFGDLGLGGKNPNEPYGIDFGIAGISNSLGCQLKFFDHALPQVVPMNVSLDEAIKLNVPNPETTYPISDMIRQADEIKTKYGRCIGDVCNVGILVIALDIRGQDIFMDMHDRPDDTRKLLEICTRAFTKCVKTVRAVTGYDGLVVPGNCPLAMISNQCYVDFVKPFDEWLSTQFQPYGIHHCGKQDELIKSLCAVPNVSHVDVGAETTIDLIPKYWGVDKKINITAFSLEKRTEDEVGRDIIAFLEGIGEPYDRINITVEATQYTPDSKVRAVYAAFDDFKKNLKSKK